MSRGDGNILTPFSARSRVSTGRSNLAAAGMTIASPGRQGTAASGEHRKWYATKSEAMADQKRRARAEVGLTEVGLPVNERDYMEVSLGYRDKMSRSDIVQQRRAEMSEQLENTRRSVEGSFMGQVERLEARENQDHLLRQKAMVTTPNSLGQSSVLFIKTRDRQNNKNDLLNKWQAKVDSKLPLDPNTHVSPEDRPAFWSFKPGFHPAPTFLSRSELLEHRRKEYSERLRAVYPQADVRPPTQTEMLKPLDRSAKWDTGKANFAHFRY